MMSGGWGGELRIIQLRITNYEFECSGVNVIKDATIIKRKVLHHVQDFLYEVPIRN